MSNDNPWGDGYDPEAERCCSDCGKIFKTKEGVLHNRYEFHCSPCHMWWKATWKKVYIGGGILLSLVVIGALLYVFDWFKKSKKKSPKELDYDDED